MPLQKHRFAVVSMLALLITAGFMLVGLPYGEFNWRNTLAAYIEPPVPEVFIVNAGDDIDDGTCDVVHCSLREAINAANLNMPAEDTINFALSYPLEINLSAGLPPITDDIRIAGPGMEFLAIDGMGAYRPFTIASGVSAEISGLKIQNGLAFQGGGIYTEGPLILSNSAVQFNTVTTMGGGIYASYNQMVSITGCVLLNNTAGGSGGGLAAEAGSYVTVYESAVVNNSAQGWGGGLYSEGELDVNRTTLTGNHSDLDGGGFSVAGGFVELTNSTISGNTAVGTGGGIQVEFIWSTIRNSTFYNNSSGTGGTLAGTGEIVNSIVAGTASGADCDGIFVDAGNNIIEDGTCGFGLAADPNLGPLQDNGGFGWTHMPLVGSPAIGTGDFITCLLPPVSGVDQRGVSRLDRPGCDIGAVETTYPVAPTGVAATPLSAREMAVTWTDNNTDETAYHIERSADGVSGWTEIGTTPADTTGYSDRPLTCGTPYYYKVRAYRSSDDSYSEYSAVASATTAGCTDANLVDNPAFFVGESGWGFFGEIWHAVNSEVLEIYRETVSPSGAAVWQVLDYAPPADASFEVTLDIGNISAGPKEMWVTLRQPDWSDFMTCYFSMAAGTPLTSVTMYGHTQMAWSDMVLEIAPSPADSVPAIQLDNVTVVHRTDLSITETSCVSTNLPPSGNLIVNPTFDSGTDGWTFWGEIWHTWNPAGDVSFWRETPSPYGAALYQDLNYTTLANAPFEVTADLANDSDVTKDVWLTLRSPDWTDFMTCRFTLTPFTPMTNYTMRGRSTTGWSGIRLEVVPGPADSVPAIRIDNVTVDHKPSLDTFVTECVRSEVPSGEELVQNGDFSAGDAGWYTWGDIAHTVTGGVLNFWRTATITAGGAVMYQDLNVQAVPGMPFEVLLDLGNSSGVAKHMWVTLRNYSWSDYFTCYFELPAGTPLGTYTMRGKTSVPWSNMRLELWAGPPDGVQALLADNISVKNAPGLDPTGVECFLPGGAPGAVVEEPEVTPTVEPTTEPTVEPVMLETIESDDARVTQSGEWIAHATELASGGAYLFSSGSVDDTLSLSFSGTRLEVVYVQHPALGVFAVEVDGAVLQTVDSVAEDAAFGVSVIVSDLAEGDHVVRIVPVSGTVAIDAFVVEASEVPVEPTPEPTIEPTVEPTTEPTVEPTPEPTVEPVTDVETIESDDARVAQTGLWTLTAGDLASGGAYLFSSGSVEDTLTLTFSGPRVDVVYVKHPALGTFTIEVDSAVLYTVNSAGEQNTFGAVVALNGLGEGVHTLRIAPVSGTVAIDAFVVEPQGEVPVVPTVEPTTEPTPEPTEVVPTVEPTVEPTEVVPTETPVPTEVVPTEVPPSATPEPTDAPAETPVGPSKPGLGSQC